MSRHTHKISDHTSVVSGNDHAIGQFIDVTDSRYANSDLDEQGEGYLVEWSTLFGFTQNKIGITIEQLKASPEVVVEIVNKFIGELCS
jgi:hypothetical protein